MALDKFGNGVNGKAARLSILAPGPARGGWDETAQAVGAALMEVGFAESVDVTCRPGAGGTKGLEEFVKGHAGDPNALFVGGYVLVGSAIGNKSALTLSDLTPLARLTGESEAVAVPASSPVRTIEELLDKFRRDPAAITWAGGSFGGVGQVALSLIARAAGIAPKLARHAHYSSAAEAAAATARGEAQAVVTGYRELVHLGDALRVLAVAAARPLPGVDAPTLNQRGLSVEIMNWRMIAAAPGIGDKRERELGAAIKAMVASAAWKKTLDETGWEDRYLAGADFKEFLAQQTHQTLAALREAGAA